MPKKEKKPVGRPRRPMPDQIPDTPENVARAMMSTPPKRKEEWRYLKKQAQQDEDTAA